MSYPSNYPRWFYELSPREQRKQVNRWRYHRQYQRKRLGNNWSAIWASCSLFVQLTSELSLIGASR